MLCAGFIVLYFFVIFNELFLLQARTISLKVC